MYKLNKWQIGLGATVLVMVAVFYVINAAQVSAHEHREVGDYEFVFGWQVEPAFAGVYNGPELTITDVATGDPVEGAETDLTLTVTFGPESKELDLEPAWNDPGHYIAHLTPTRPGDYEFELTGTISVTSALTPTVVSEIFTSADGEFGTIEPASDLLFPDTEVDMVTLYNEIEDLKEELAALQEELAELQAAQVIHQMSSKCLELMSLTTTYQEALKLPGRYECDQYAVKCPRCIPRRENWMPRTALTSRFNSFRLFYSLLLLTGTLWPQVAHAHAIVERAEPAANAVLAEPPSTVRLWFTEPLEPAYSRFELRDSAGMVVADASVLDATDSRLLVMPLTPLPDGVYTVVWRNVSAADGHPSEGSFPFTIGSAVAGLDVETVATPPTSLALGDVQQDTVVRWFNLLSLALTIGGLAFVVLVWQPAPGMDARQVARPLRVTLWLGWLAIGIAGGLILLAQTAAITDRPLAQPEGAMLAQVITETRFGTLWLLRMALWLLLGLLLALAGQRRTRWAVALLCGLGLLLPTSLTSHAAATPVAWLAIASDWLHFSMTAFWLGGLALLAIAIPVLHRQGAAGMPTIAQLAANFSNYARVAVIGLILTGFYAAWLQTGSWDGLTTTLYGRLLGMKLLLALPLLLLASINLFWTQRRLAAGAVIWVGRLRGIVGAEVTLLVAILVLVGAMTSLSPTRDQLALAAAAALPTTPAPQPLSLTETEDALQVHLIVTPGWVGNNRFIVHPVTTAGETVTDLSLIRLRFEHQDLGRSELRIESGEGGEYQVEGANLSAPGEWQIRMTVQRPGEFDTVLDFAAQVAMPPAPPPPPPPLAVYPDGAAQRPVLWTVGLLALVAGGYFLGQQRLRVWQGPGVLASLLVLLGLAFLIGGLMV